MYSLFSTNRGIQLKKTKREYYLNSQLEFTIPVASGVTVLKIKFRIFSIRNSESDERTKIKIKMKILYVSPLNHQQHSTYIIFKENYMENV